jgi:hypothetical protein
MVLMEHPVLQDLKEISEHPGRRVPRVIKETLVPQDLLAQRVIKETLDPQDLQEKLVPRGTKAIREIKEIPEFLVRME